MPQLRVSVRYPRISAEKTAARFLFLLLLLFKFKFTIVIKSMPNVAKHVKRNNDLVQK